MFNKILFYLFLFCTCLPAWAGKCLINEALKNPDLNSNPLFWEELSAASQNGKPTDQQVQAIIEKFIGKQPEPQIKSAGSTLEYSYKKTLTYNIQHKAKKEINGLPQNLKNKIDEFIAIVTQPNGVQKIRDNPGRWHFEKIIDEGKQAYTVRVNDGYRVLFDLTEDSLQIRRVNKGQIHGN